MSKQFELARGVNALSRSKQIKRKGRFKHFGKGGNKKSKAENTDAFGLIDTVGKDTKKTKAGVSKYYPAEDVQKKLNRRFKPKTAKLRKSITPGTVLILLAGRFRGKRVVFLKQLESGLLLVTGPYKVNGVPIRRVNQSFVIATKTKVANVGNAFESINEAEFFARTDSGDKKGENAFFDVMKPTGDIIKAERKQMQKSVDKAILDSIKDTEHLRAYLNSKFSLKQGQYPHDLVF
jgi:large subunit ribosomal protein L6e